MSWQLEFRPEVSDDVVEAAEWYESREPGLGEDFVDEIMKVWDAIAVSPLLGSRRHPAQDIRWRYPKRFPYRVIYSIDESRETALVIAILHAARHDSRWQQRIP
ncbi:MAG: type II toxin-antitoxin system RelE/ParE family toxin [Luteolibacter sp.]